VYLRRGEPKRARVELERGLATAIETSNRYQEVRALIYLVMAHLGAGEPAEAALGLAKRATQLAREAQIPQGHAWGLAMEALALGAAGRAAEAVGRSAEAALLLDSGPHFQDREEVLHIHARALRDAGRSAEAAAVVQRAWEEVQAKARRVRNPSLRERYLSTPPACEIVRDWESRQRAERPPSPQ
jgi:hypothetical protein